MPKRAVLIGGTGQIGCAIALKLLQHGWDVILGHRGQHEVPKALQEKGVKAALFDRDEQGALAKALKGGADAIIDLVAFTPEHAAQLLAIQGDVGAFVVISSASVYRDAKGCTLDEAREFGPPELPDPIPETHPTVEPGPATYSTRKVAIERLLLENATQPVTILRPCAVHGIGAQHPREWWFVRRMLDERPAIPLAYEGASRFHTTAVDNIAALALRSLEMSGTRVLNIGDPVALSVLEIGRLIAQQMNYEGRFIELADPALPSPVGHTPWSVRHPFVLDLQAARDLGYEPATTYDAAIGPLCRWLMENAATGPWPRFDYETEDRYLADLTRPRPPSAPSISMMGRGPAADRPSFGRDRPITGIVA